MNGVGEMLQSSAGQLIQPPLCLLPGDTQGPLSQKHTPACHWSHWWCLLTIDTWLALHSERDLRSLGFRLQNQAKCICLTIYVLIQESPTVVARAQSPVSTQPMV